MLFLSPAWIEPTVTTATSRGSTSRETIVCRRITVAAAITTGSIVECGREPWPPRPRSVTVSPSDAAICVPERTPIVPAGSGVTCWPSTMSGFGKRSSTPSAIIACEPAPYSSAGWKTATIVPDHSSFVATQALERAEQRGDVHVVAARVHHRHVEARRGRCRARCWRTRGRCAPRRAGRPCRRAARRPAPRRCAIDADDAGLADALFELDAELGRGGA